jgi:hydantoinase/carbamoylase family amidase
MAKPPIIDAQRVIEDLRELARRTSDDAGAQRLCWGEGWRAARELLGELLGELGLEREIDEAGNAWAYLPGEREPALALGSHVDSVPNGGWLDGALGVMGGLGVLRAWAGTDRPPPRTLALVDWADEEGARFGRSLFGSSAAAGTFDPAELKDARDAEGRAAPEVLAENGVELERVVESRSRLDRLGAYLELHIEQGPVMEAEGIAAAAVNGCVGVERLRFLITGRVSHAGTTPMDDRRDAGLAAAEAALRVEQIATGEGGVGTVGEIGF